MRKLILAFGLSLALPAFAMPEFTLVAENGRFTPDVIEVPANTRFKLTVTNRNEGPEEFETASPLKELVVAPGVTRSTVYPPLRPGTYEFFGEFHKETAKGRIVAK